ncbi:hypothetical protein KDM41_11835 [bacterium]|nr:hypothetical protein [bacterium]
MLAWLVLAALAGGAVAPARAAATAAAPVDTVRATHWGPLPARTDSTSAVFREQPRPAWETAVLVPYWVVGIPFRIVYGIGDFTIKKMDAWGLFGRPGDYPGLKGPFGTYIMPSLSINDLEGTALGVDVRRPDFLGAGNMLFLRADRSTRRAGAYAGGALFHLGDTWQLETGGGFESVNQAKYYGVGPYSSDADLSYYYRSTSWGGFDLNRDVGASARLGVRTYYSRVNVREPSYNTGESVGNVHAGDLPFGYPGQSSGWTLRLGLDRDNAEQTGRPRYGGYQSGGLSLFQATDSSEVSYLLWHGNIEKFIRLWHTDRTLAVRVFGNRISSLGEGAIPFSRLVTFQRPDELRGFTSLRFYGLGSVGVSVEYRWPVWVARGRDDLGVDAYLFSDSGQVFNHTAEISLDNWEFTGGVGLRLVDAGRHLAARFELGLSDEDLVVRLKFSQTFQYNPRGFLHGKNPTKIR